MERDFTKKDLVEPFKVIHFSGEKRMAQAENNKGFLCINHFAPFIGNWNACLLRKPQWERLRK